MPKYMECESEDDSTGDDEVILIPYVKPPPLLIDLIEEEEEERSPKKKKSKKRKKSKDEKKEGTVVADENHGIDNVRWTIERVCRNAEPSVVVANENILIATSNNLGSNYVANLSKSFGGNAESSPPEMDSLPFISVSNSIFEPGLMLDTEVTPTGVGSTSNGTPPKAKRKRAPADPKRPKRISQTSATKKTAEEISSFLNTLGIPIEVRDLNPPTPRKPRGSKRKSEETSAQTKEKTPLSSSIAPETPTILTSISTLSGESTSTTLPTPEDAFVQANEENGKKKGSRRKKIASESTAAVQSEKEGDHPRPPEEEVSDFSGTTNTTTETNGDHEISKKKKRVEKENGDKVSKKSGGNLLSSPSSKKSKQKENEEPERRKRKRSEKNDEEVEVLRVNSNEEVPIDPNTSLRGDSGEKKAKERSSSQDKEKERHGRSPTKKKSQNLPPDTNLLDTESSNRKAAEEEILSGAVNDRSLIDNTSVQENEETENSETAKKANKNAIKEKEKTKSPQKDKDTIRMPRPPGVGCNATPKSNAAYFLNHPGFPSAMPTNMKEYYGTFQGSNYDYREINKTQSNNPRLWRTPEDFGQRKTPRLNVRCENCFQWDHTTNKCPEKDKPIICSCCGGTDHTANGVGKYACPESCCLNCGSRNNVYVSGCRKCIYSKDRPKCNICGIQCHRDDSCPDNWRRYHSITHSIPEGNEKIVPYDSVYKKRFDAFCSNCGGKGHNYYHCTKERYKKNPYHRHKPYVVKELDFSNIQLPAVADGGATCHLSSTSAATIQTPADAPICDKTVTVDSNENSEIRVQIQNDSPPSSEPSTETRAENDHPEKLRLFDDAPTRCMENGECRNRISKFHKCHSIAVSPFQINLLSEADKTGAIQNIVMKMNVEICMLSSLKVHICGEKWRQAENELYDLLFARAKTGLNLLNSSETVQEAKIDSSFPSAPSGQLPTSSMDVDERFVSPEDLITNVPIIRPDGPFAPGQYVPYSILPPLLQSTANVPPQGIPLMSPIIQILPNPNPSFDEVNVNSADLMNKSIPKRSPSKKVPPKISAVDSEDDDVVILEEKIDLKKSRSLTSEKDKGKAVKRFNSRDGLNVILLPSEWELVFSESLKTEGILSKISRLFKVSIFVCNETNTCTIHNGSAFDRDRAKEKVTLWLGCIAAKKTFVLEMPNESLSMTFSPEEEPETEKKSLAAESTTPNAILDARIKCSMRYLRTNRRLNPSPNIPIREHSYQHTRKGSGHRETPNSRNTSRPRVTRYFNRT